MIYVDTDVVVVEALKLCRMVEDGSNNRERHGRPDQ